MNTTTNIISQRKTRVRASSPSAFIKWVGGKQSLAQELVKHFPTNIEDYVEPFLGGGSVFFQVRPKHAVLTDSNSWLIETYTAIKEDWARVAAILDNLENCKEKFLALRSVRHETLELFTKAAHFIYLNKTCFRGLFRVNRSGQFNVPFGNYDRRYYDPENLRSVSILLEGAELRTGDFESGILGSEANSFIYFDPPYYKLGGYSDFNRYTANQFRAIDHLRLAALCNELTDRGVRWAMSNSATPFIRDLYKQYRLVSIKARREINLNSNSRDVEELLILNYD
jgi:DNA adenine methylase